MPETTFVGSRRNETASLVNYLTLTSELMIGQGDAPGHS